MGEISQETAREMLISLEYLRKFLIAEDFYKNDLLELDETIFKARGEMNGK